MLGKCSTGEPPIVFFSWFKFNKKFVFVVDFICHGAWFDSMTSHCFPIYNTNTHNYQRQRSPIDGKSYYLVN